MNGWMDGWKNGQVDGWTDGGMDEWTDGWMGDLLPTAEGALRLRSSVKTLILSHWPH